MDEKKTNNHVKRRFSQEEMPHVTPLWENETVI